MPVGVACMIYDLSPIRSVLRHLIRVYNMSVFVAPVSDSIQPLPRWSSSFWCSTHHSKYGCLNQCVVIRSAYIGLRPYRFSFLSIIICMMFFLIFSLILIATFDVLCCHAMFMIRRYYFILQAFVPRVRLVSLLSMSLQACIVER